MPLFLLLLLILLLLLEDAGAQQGEWFPRSARRAEPRGGAVGAPREPPGRRVSGPLMNLQTRGIGAVRFGAWPDLAPHSLG